MVRSCKRRREKDLESMDLLQNVDHAVGHQRLSTIPRKRVAMSANRYYSRNYYRRSLSYYLPDKALGILDMPDEILVRIIDHVWDTPSSGYVDDYSLHNYGHEAYGLCCNNSKLYKLFRSSVRALCLENFDDISEEAFARLFARSIRHLSLQTHPNMGTLINALAERKSCLETIVLHLGVPHEVRASAVNAFVRLAYSSRTRLKFLQLNLDMLSVDIDYATLKLALRNLKLLSLSSMGEMTHANLLVLLSGPGPNLRRLSLDHVAGVFDGEPRAIREMCPGIQNLDLVIGEDVSDSEVREFVLSFGKELRHFDCWGSCGPALSSESFTEIMEKCSSLRHVAIEEPRCDEPHKLLDALQLRSESLHSIRFYEGDDLAPFAPTLRLALPKLRALYLDGFASTNTATMLIESLGRGLHVLFIGSSFDEFDSKLFAAIGKCTELRELGMTIFRDSYRNRMRAKKGLIEKMFKGAGSKLRFFSWFAYIRFDGLARRGGVRAAEELSGAYLARCLWKYCSQLQFIHVLRMRPEVPADGNMYELAFKELQRRLPNAVILLGRPLPNWPGRTWYGEEIDYGLNGPEFHVDIHER